MVEMNKSRLKFSSSGQALFITKVQEKLNLNPGEIAQKLGISLRTFCDWKKEKHLIPCSAAEKLSGLSGVSVKKFGPEILDEFWYVKEAAQKGGRSTFSRYGNIGGDKAVRTEKWRKWWHEEGRDKQKHIGRQKPFKRPGFSEDLAEFVGIMLGDGGISEYQFTITLHIRDDKEYSVFIRKMMHKLLGVVSAVYYEEKDSALSLVVSRRGLVEFFVKNLGLKKGNKIVHQVDIPNWIKRRSSYKKACIRGLVDTDGSVYDHKYKVAGKEYSYKKIDFGSASVPLRFSVFNFLKGLEIKSRINGNKVTIEDGRSVKRYMEIIGSHNPKHLLRYKK